MKKLRRWPEKSSDLVFASDREDDEVEAELKQAAEANRKPDGRHRRMPAGSLPAGHVRANDPGLTGVHGVSSADQHRSNLEPVPHAIDIGDDDWRDRRVVDIDAEAVSQLLVETAGGGEVSHGAPLDLQVTLWQCSTMPPSGDARPELLSGTLELIVLRTLTVMGSQHAYGIAARIEQVAEQAIRLNQGTLYPALVRLEQKGWIKGAWQTTENNREAKYYTITRSGVRALSEQAAWWQRSAGLVNRLLTSEAE